MQPVNGITVSAQDVSAPIVVDYAQNNFNVGFGVVVSGGATLTYKVQHTYDDPSTDATGATLTWFDHATVTGKSADADGSYTSPIRALRLNVTAYTSGSATITVLQGRK